MGSLAGLPTDEVMQAVLGDRAAGQVIGHADVLDQLDAAHEAAIDATSPRLLELCRLRIAMMLGSDAEAAARTPDSGVDDETIAALASWPTDLRFDADDRAALAFTEHFVIDVATLDDATAAALGEHLGDTGLTNFTHALLVVEQRIRLRLAWDRLLGGS